MSDPASKEIEVEVVEIDGVPLSRPSPDDGNPAATPRMRDWRQWGGRVRELDSRWWPLWVVLGTLALALLLTVGLAIAVIYVIFSALRRFCRALFS